MANGGKEIVLKLSQEYELISTCYHEAGHTLIGLLHFMKIPLVMVNYIGKRVAGSTHYENYSEQIENPKIISYLLMSEIRIYSAGTIAEKIHYKDICGAEKLPRALKEGSSSDISAVAELITKNNLVEPGQKRYAFKQKVNKEIAHQLKEFWPDVKIIAHALYKSKRLYFNDLKELLIKKSKNKKFWKARFREINSLLEAPGIFEEKMLSLII